MPAERELLYRLAMESMARFESPIIVNIGVSWGASVHCLRAGAPSARLVAIDTDYETRPVQAIEQLQDVEFVEADSTQYSFKSPVHLLFVDGGHDYETVWGDISNWIAHIPPGGMLAFHDYAPEPRDAKRLAGVRQAIDEWRNEDWQEVERVLSIVVFRRLA